MLRLLMMLAARQKLSKGLALDLASVSTSALSVLRLVLYLIVTVAAFGTIVIAAVGSPRSGGDIPTCYYSLAMSIAVVLSFLLSRRRQSR